MAMERVYEHANDLHVRAQYAYVYNTALYEDADHTTALKAATVKDAFEKGNLVIVDTGVYYTPLYMNSDTNYFYFGYVKPDTTTATTAVMAKAKAAKN